MTDEATHHCTARLLGLQAMCFLAGFALCHDSLYLRTLLGQQLHDLSLASCRALVGGAEPMSHLQAHVCGCDVQVTQLLPNNALAAVRLCLSEEVSPRRGGLASRSRLEGAPTQALRGQSLGDCPLSPCTLTRPMGLVRSRIGIRVCIKSRMRPSPSCGGQCGLVSGCGEGG